MMVNLCGAKIYDVCVISLARAVSFDLMFVWTATSDSQMDGW